MKDKNPTRRPKAGKKAVAGVHGPASRKVEKAVPAKTGPFRSNFRNTLLVKRQELEDALNALMTRQKEYENLLSADDFIEKGDHAEREIAAQTHYSLLERKNRELKKIEILIRRIDQDKEFGICEECGKRIPPRRLLIVPDATRCVPCQQETEKMDSRGNSADKYYSTPRQRKESDWEDSDDLDDEEGMIFKPDMEYESFLDLDETDIVEPRADKKEP
jgi:DnaK suppressor protein